ncbi:glycosyltransferase family 4 protein [Terrilactibacillus sp. S3-3]|nr:glycosyltransferase family 4 protein [Terrilactibacillus sp. S3-3]
MDYIGYIGRIDPGKGWEIFIEALSKLKAETDFFAGRKAVIAGGGQDYQKMVHLIAAGGLQEDVLLLGMLPQSQLKDIYNGLSVFCFPTMRKAESLGLVGLEAMACGVPVIASRIGGIRDYLEDGVNGLFFPPGSAEELAAKIIEYTKFNDQKKSAMKAACLETASRYDTEAIEPAFVRLFLP